MRFRWNEWNVEHIAEHGVMPTEAESVVENARRPFPREMENEKYLVWGRGRGGRLLQVIYIFSPDDVVFVIHARPLTDREKRRFRKQTK